MNLKGYEKILMICLRDILCTYPYKSVQCNLQYLCCVLFIIHFKGLVSIVLALNMHIMKF